MPGERIFLGWDEPATKKVGDFLLAAQERGTPLDLSGDLIVVPTRHAGRRLREALAVRSAEKKMALLSPQVVTPSYFLRPEDSADVATPTDVIAVWADTLCRADTSRLPALFPARTPDKSFPWGMRVGEMIQRLRDALADGGYRVIDVVENHAEKLDEPDRWNDLAILERAYLDRLGELGKRDPCDLMIERAENPRLPPRVRRLLVAAVPDPTPLMVRALGQLVAQTPVLILIAAPDSLSEHFDLWGRPLPETWQQSLIDIPDPEANLVPAASPNAQCRIVLSMIAAESDRFGPADIAIGVPDASLAPILSAALADRGLPSFDPAGTPVSAHPIYRLLQHYRSLVTDGTYPSLSAVMRHPDVIRSLEREFGATSLEMLTQLDTFQNRHLPSTFEDAFRRLASPAALPEFSRLAAALASLARHIDNYRTQPLNEAVRGFLQAIYDSRPIDPADPADQEFAAVAEIIEATVRELESDPLSALGVQKAHALDLLLWRLANQRFYPEPPNALIDIEGWLELPWNDAPFLIVTGMNEGSVPAGRLDDVFLPDTLRTRLQIRNDADRLAADAFIMRGLIESRRNAGRVCFISGKTNASGDPLRPSRLLFRCPDDELPERATRLFGEPPPERESRPATVSFRLDASPPPDTPAPRLDVSQLPVTAFADYLACPFRFYLKHILRMEPLDDLKREMDALDFGSLVHHALRAMGDDIQANCTEDEQRLSRFLHSVAEQWVRDRFGTSPPLSVQIQLDSARQRLSAAARAHCELVRDGWQVLATERQLRTRIGPIDVVGRIDRIDRHIETGALRVLDYKTQDKTTLPEAAHLAGPTGEDRDYARHRSETREKRWIDLQLPLYRVLIEAAYEPQAPVDIGYFNLPKAISETGIVLWPGFGDELLASARRCAQGVVRDIVSRRYWPPASKVRYDDFEALLHATPDECIDVRSFLSSLGTPVTGEEDSKSQDLD